VSAAVPEVSAVATAADLPVLPALVVGSVHHTRHTPFRRSFTHRHYAWLVDLAAPPHLPLGLRWLAGFRGEDHLDGAPGLDALRADVAGRLDAAGIDPVGLSRIVMLAHGRVAGHVFNPMSAFWCFAGDGSLLGVVVEVHNTYGGRHAYVMRPGADGQDRAPKEFYVSPFNDVSGEYAIRFHLRPDRASVAIRLTVGSEPLITASVAGRCVPATTATVVRTALRHPFMTQRVTALIRAHGIRLWLRRLPVHPRPPVHTEQRP